MTPSVFFTSDTHYDHARIIEYSKRPFSSVEEMNEQMVLRWNSIVRPGDSVYHLGDFSLGRPERATQFAKRLMGNKFLVFGNHDRRLRREPAFLACWREHGDYRELQVAGERIVLSHYAMRTWNQSHRGAWQLFGHSHGSLRDEASMLQLDVGVDCWDYQPVALEVVRARMRQKTWRPVDHHGRGDDE